MGLSHCHALILLPVIKKKTTMDENKEIRKQVNDLLGREISDEETQGIDSVKLLSERGGLVWKSVCFDG